MKKVKKNELIDWFEFSDDVDETLDKLREFIKRCKEKGYFDIELEGCGMQIYGTRYETDEEYEFRVSKVRQKEEKERQLYERLKQKFDPIFQSMEFPT